MGKPDPNEVITITFPKWEKYQSGLKNKTWFKVPVSILYDPKIRSLDCQSVTTWLLLLATASQIGHPIVTTRRSLQGLFCQRRDRLANRLQRLQQLNLIILSTEERRGEERRGDQIQRSSDPRQTELVLSPSSGSRSVHSKSEIKRRSHQSGRSKPMGLGVTDPAYAVVNCWKEICSELPQPEKITPKRVSSIRARWKEEPDQNYWNRVARAIAGSRFCCGENDRGWRADFDWFIKPDTHVKVLEGKYSKRKKKTSRGFGGIP